VRGDFLTVGELHWEIGRKRSGLWVVVPDDFQFNVSIPWWASWAFDPEDERFLKAAALHDYLLKQGWDRVTAAGVFNEALRADKVSARTRLAMVTGVAWYKWS
tara:strand:+ start:437 stop:745 length:309 start_codon:yes stop_codon:yes gene_type:complete